MEKFNEYKKQVKDTIEHLININDLEHAKLVIKEYEDIVINDVDILSFKAVIGIMEGNLEEAREIISRALAIDSKNVDLLFNLGYSYEIENKTVSAYREYKKVKKIASGELLAIIDDKLREYESYAEVVEYNKRHKVLIIAYIFPPLGGSGVQRTLKFVKYLRDFGWEPIIVTVGESKFSFKDETMLTELPDEIEIIRMDHRLEISKEYALELINLFQTIINDNDLMKDYIDELNKTHKNFEQMIFMPDTFITWVKDLLDNFSKLVDIDNIDLLYSTSGPHSDHILAYFLKQKYRKPWVADFRDEWTNNPYVRYNTDHITYKIHRNMESKILALADKVITTTELATENYIEDFNLEKNKVLTITNGYDEEDFTNLNNCTMTNKKFTIIHNGMLYMLRTPETFLKAITSLLLQGSIRKEHLRIIFSWTENEEYWKQYIKDHNLQEVVMFSGYQSHADSLQTAMEADVLLLIVGDGEKNRAVYTGKVFEYLRICKPILALSPKDSLVERLIKNTSSGRNVEFTDIKGIENYILEMYQKWANDENADLKLSDKVKKYERKELTNQLSKIFAEALTGFREKLQEEVSLKLNRDKNFQDLKNKFKENIEILIRNQMLYEAKTLISEYSSIAPEDRLGICSIRAVIAVTEGDYNSAESVLREALIIDGADFDINYNLAYVYENNKEYIKSLHYYRNAYFNTKDYSHKDNIRNIISNILIENGISLDVDQFLKEIDNNNRQKCLILCQFYSVFAIDFMESMKKYYDINFDIVTMDEKYFRDNRSFQNIYIYKDINELKGIFENLKRYDIIHIHFLNPYYSVVSNKIRHKCDKLIVSIWGSDFYRSSNEDRDIQKFILDYTDCITIANEATIDEFNQEYKGLYKDKIYNCRFGLKPLEYIENAKEMTKNNIKEELGISNNSIVVACGYNGSPVQNHLQIIDSIVNNEQLMLEDIYYLLPMTYGGSKEYIKQVKDKLDKYKFKYFIYDSFLDNIMIAKIRNVSDIMIQLQNTDQLSGSMQEHLFCNNLVITGKWLPYNILKDKGCYFLEIEHINEIGSKLKFAVDNLDLLLNKCKNNNEIIVELSLWKNVVRNWINIYNK